MMPNLTDMNDRKRKRMDVFVTALAVLVFVALVFLMFCLTELFINMFTGGWFSWVFPSAATALFVLALLALAVVSGGAE